MQIPIISIVGKSDSGKTTLIEKLVSELKSKEYKIATIKHDVHGFEIDHPGKDSYRHKHAGSFQTIISSPKQIAIIKDSDRDLEIDEIIENYINDVDIILTEGYKRNNKKKIEVHRKEMNQELLCNKNDNVLAIATDEELDSDFPQYNINDSKGLVNLIELELINKKNHQKVELIVDGKKISLKPFLIDMLSNSISGLIKSLKDCDDAKDITLKIKK